MSRISCHVSLILISVLVPLVTPSAGQNPNAKLAIHVKDHDSEQDCGNLTIVEHCDDVVSTYPGYSFDLMPVFFDLNGVISCEYGLTWPLWTYDCLYTSCSDLTIGSIDQPGDGISQAWNECQTGYTIIPGWGWFHATSPGRICPVQNPQQGYLGIYDCDYGLDEFQMTFCAGVNGAEGDDLCEAYGTERSTWGSLKYMLR
jgi:hypothetical protein